MARIRTIKPEFWTSEQVVECSPVARLLFIGLWNFSDDAGRHRASIKRLKMEIFPGDSFSDDQMMELVSELLAQGLIREYTVNGQAYWQITGWHHQRIEKPTYRYPRPLDNGDAKIDDHSTTLVDDPSRRPFDDHSTTTPRPFDDSSGTECNGMEGNGSIDTDRAAPPGVAQSPAEAKPRDHQTSQKNIRNVLDAYVQLHPRAKPGKREKSLIRDRLGEGYTERDLINAIEGCHVSPWHCGENPEKTKYQSLSLIMRDSSHVAHFIEIQHTPAKRRKQVDQTLRQNLHIAGAVRLMRHNGATQKQIEEFLDEQSK